MFACVHYTANVQLFVGFSLVLLVFLSALVYLSLRKKGILRMYEIEGNCKVLFFHCASLQQTLSFSHYNFSSILGKLEQYLDKSDAKKLSERMFEMIRDLNLNSRKRPKEDSENLTSKKRREDAILEPGKPSPGQLTAIQVSICHSF
jgi:hypothetical protein